MLEDCGAPCTKHVKPSGWVPKSRLIWISGHVASASAPPCRAPLAATALASSKAILSGPPDTDFGFARAVAAKIAP